MELYRATQGEGIRIGQPSVFVRLFGCNMRCGWCDTPYSINRKEWKAWVDGIRWDLPPKEPYEAYTIARLVSDILTLRQPDVVFTGGEPLIQGDILLSLLNELHELGLHTTVETNASIFNGRAHLIMHPEMHLWSLSPKLSGAGERAWFDPDTIRKFMVLPNARGQLKFVVDRKEELLEIQDLLLRLPVPKEPGWPVVLQPNGDILEHQGIWDYLYRLEYLQNEVQVRGIRARVLPQLHAMIHGRKRFV
jgi:7-carboxy-7-deazaguanine synthase